MTVTAIVDLTTGLLPLRAQLTRPTCVAFSLSELNQLARTVTAHLSAEYLYRAAARRMAGWVPDGEGLTLQSSADALQNDGQPTDVVCPYLHTEPAENPPTLPDVGGAPMFAGQASFKWMDVDAITDRLNDGKPVGVVVRVTDTFMNPGSDVVADSMVVPTNGNHAVIAAGYGTHQDSMETHVLVRNTWGPAWGKQGMAWLPRAYLTKHGLVYFEVD